MKHKTKLGERIPLNELELDHLKNIIRWIEKKAGNGLMVIHGSAGGCAEDMWGEVEHLYGEEAKRHLDYYKYVEELKRRQI